MDFKRVLQNKENENIFTKTTAGPVIGAAEKAALNRKGNILANSGDFEGARRIFLTTGYSDGLVRVGDHYRSRGLAVDALRMYWLAPDRKKAEPIISKLSMIIQNLLKEEGDHE